MTNKTLKAPARNNKQVQEYVAAARRGLNGQFVTKSAKGWSVQRVGAQRASGVFATKTEAVKHASAVAKNQKTEVYIFDTAGKLANRKSY